MPGMCPLCKRRSASYVCPIVPGYLFASFGQRNLVQ
jgi:hypothetical protein